MTTAEILTKAIEKAIAGGWHKNGYDTVVVGNRLNIFFHNECKEHRLEDFSKDYSPADIIFNHDFAKALWPGQITGPGFFGPLWYFHLQQMVIADDPIEYLGDNI